MNDVITVEKIDNGYIVTAISYSDDNLNDGFFGGSPPSTKKVFVQTVNQIGEVISTLS